jgi:hypothetical protein
VPRRPTPVLLLALAGCGEPELVTRVLDDDQDGWGADVDCNDLDIEMHPGIPNETCDGKDNDCNGLVDDDVPDELVLHWYADGDQDTYGAGDAVAVGCEGPPGASLLYTDCDDDNPDIYPGAEEICDAIDQDCTPGEPACK